MIINLLQRLITILALLAGYECIGGPKAKGEVVTVWNELTLKAIRYANVPPPLAVRQLAVAQLAIWDAVHTVEGKGKSRFVEGSAPKDCLVEAAVSAAAYQSLRVLLPKSAEMWDSHYRSALSALPNNEAKTNGLAWGKKIAVAALLERQFDGSGAGAAFVTNTFPGYWQRTWPNYDFPLLPNWGRMKLFAIPGVETFRPPPPPALNSAEWAAQYNLVKSIGGTNSTTRTLQQREIALFWADGAGTESPPGHWNRIAQQVIERKGYGLEESARLLAALNVAMSDACVVTWDCKYVYNFWRPSTAIPAGDTDGNPDTEPDPNWRPLIVTPNFPEYVSGHSAFSGAAAGLLAEWTGSDEFAFTTDSDGLPGVRRRFKRFSDAAKEAGMSRIYGGIHFPSANEEGFKCGRRIGEFVVRQFRKE